VEASLISIANPSARLQAFTGSAITTDIKYTVGFFNMLPQSVSDATKQLHTTIRTVSDGTNDVQIAPYPGQTQISTSITTGANGTVQNIAYIKAYNSNASSVTVTIQIEDGADDIQIKATLGTLESLYYEDGQGWYAMDASGNRKEALAAATNWTVNVLTVATKMSGAYMWTAWAPSDVAGTYTNASSTAASTYSDSTYFTLANASGTVTLTFVKAGSYILNLVGGIANAAAYTQEDVRMTLGGTATRYRLDLSSMVIGAGDSASDSDWRSTETVGIVATAGQTVTILPAGRVTSGGVVGNFGIAAGFTVMYCGG
jgi:hypothetical protein